MTSEESACRYTGARLHEPTREELARFHKQRPRQRVRRAVAVASWHRDGGMDRDILGRTLIRPPTSEESALRHRTTTVGSIS
jgi:hypothetical protein